MTQKFNFQDIAKVLMWIPFRYPTSNNSKHWSGYWSDDMGSGLTSDSGVLSAVLQKN